MKSIVAFFLIGISALVIATFGVPLNSNKGPFGLHRIRERSPRHQSRHGNDRDSSSSESHEGGGYGQQYPGYPQQYPGYPQQYPGYPQQYPGYPQQYPGYPQQYPGYPYPNVTAYPTYPTNIITTYRPPNNTFG